MEVIFQGAAGSKRHYGNRSAMRILKTIIGIALMLFMIYAMVCDNLWIGV